jgi:hypothetical protein
VITALIRAKQSGIRLFFDDSGILRVAGPRAAADIITELADSKALLAYWLALDTVRLDWRDSVHWGGDRPGRCRGCGNPTHLLDDSGRPAHKVCVENATHNALKALLTTSPARSRT